MIVRSRPSVFRLFFLRRGTIFPLIKWQVGFIMLLGLIVAVLHDRYGGLRTMDPVPFSLLGIALAIFLGFRNSASYDRWWEGRKLWGELVIRSRSGARLVLAHAADAGPEMQRRIVHRLIGFAFALQHHLRGTPDMESASFLPEAERAGAASAANRPDYVLRRISLDLAEAGRRRQIEPMLLAQVEENLTALAGVQSGCERIRLTPLPFAYTILLHRTAYLYCLALPFGLVPSTGYVTPFVVGLVSYAFFGLDALGDELEEPFGLLPNDLPLATMCRRVEIDLRDALGESELPPMPQPVDYCLM